MQARKWLAIVFIVFAKFFDRVCEIRRPDKVIFLSVIITDEGQRQGADDIFAIGVLGRCAIFIYKSTFGIAPWTGLRKEFLLHLFRQMKQNYINLDVNRIIVLIEITASMKVMLIDDWAAIGTLRTKHQFQRFTDCRLARIVAANKKCVAMEIN